MATHLDNYGAATFNLTFIHDGSLYNSEDDHLCAVLHLMKSIFQTPSAKKTGLCRSERGLCRYMVDSFGFPLELWPEICDPDESNKLNIWIRSKNSSINSLEWFVKDGEHNGLDYGRFANLCGHAHIFWRHIEVQRDLLRAILEWIEISLPTDDSEVEDCDVVQERLCWPCLIKAFAALEEGMMGKQRLRDVVQSARWIYSVVGE